MKNFPSVAILSIFALTTVLASPFFGVANIKLQYAENVAVKLGLNDLDPCSVSIFNDTVFSTNILAPYGTQCASGDVRCYCAEQYDEMQGGMVGDINIRCKAPAGSKMAEFLGKFCNELKHQVEQPKSPHNSPDRHQGGDSRRPNGHNHGGQSKSPHHKQGREGKDHGKKHHSGKQEGDPDRVTPCKKHYVVQEGDTCNKVSEKFQIPLSLFYLLNREIDENCFNLILGQGYCVG